LGESIDEEKMLTMLHHPKRSKRFDYFSLLPKDQWSPNTHNAMGIQFNLFTVIIDCHNSHGEKHEIYADKYKFVKEWRL
jgi:hypothetical protein